MKPWRLLDTPPMSAADNMALDDTLLEIKGEGRAPDTLHFLQFFPRAVLVGYHQALQEEVRLSYCRENGIDINRRITGGGALFFDENQVGWEVIADKSFFNVTIPNQKLFRQLCEPVVTALKQFGLDATFRPRNDIEINGRKISGTGGTESNEAFLFQGTMLVDFDVDTMIKCLRIPVEKLKAKEIDSIKERVTCLNWELGRTPGIDEIKNAICHGFAGHLDVELVPGGLTDEEQALFEEKRKAYRSAEWFDNVKPRKHIQRTLWASYKSPGGMTRVTIRTDHSCRRIQDIYITGDFLSFPPRGLYDLESELRGKPLNPETLKEIIDRFFESGRIRVPGMTGDDFMKPIDQVLAKAAISRYGIPLEKCNLISVVNGSFSEIIEKKPSILMLPYCAKERDCDLRYKRTCRACGECTVGDAWEMARVKKIKKTCVINYEDLWRQLIQYKEQGHSAFIGCCCEPFFIKHYDDFKRAGLPGILLDIDNTTCYELDEAKAAYAGEFSSQTQLNLPLLETILNLDGSG